MTDDTPSTPAIATETFYAGDAIGLVEAGDAVDMPDGPDRDALLEAGLLRPAPPAGTDPPADDPAKASRPAAEGRTDRHKRTSSTNPPKED